MDTSNEYIIDLLLKLKLLERVNKLRKYFGIFNFCFPLVAEIMINHFISINNLVSLIHTLFYTDNYLQINIHTQIIKQILQNLNL